MRMFKSQGWCFYWWIPWDSSHGEKLRQKIQRSQNTCTWAFQRIIPSFYPPPDWTSMSFFFFLISPFTVQIHKALRIFLQISPMRGQGHWLQDRYNGLQGLGGNLQWGQEDSTTGDGERGTLGCRATRDESLGRPALRGLRGWRRAQAGGSVVWGGCGAQWHIGVSGVIRVYGEEGRWDLGV